MVENLNKGKYLIFLSVRTNTQKEYTTRDKSLKQKLIFHPIFIRRRKGLKLQSWIKGQNNEREIFFYPFYV